MLLIYLDESGINYKKKNGFFIDGPYVIWCGMLIPENKYFHLERLYCELAGVLGIKDWRTVEAHATDIWARKNNFSSLSEITVKNYFEELFQLLVKLDIKIVFGLQEKKAQTKWNKVQEIEKTNCRYALLHGLEHRLSQLNETGVIISDESDDVIDDLLFERTQWRFNPGARKTKKQRSRFKFETQSCFLLDRVHFIDSKKSVFLQIADQVAFVMQRVFTYAYLLHSHKKPLSPDKTKVPISSETFAFTCPNILMSAFDETHKDVLFLDLKEVADGNRYLNNKFFTTNILKKKIK